MQILTSQVNQPSTQLYNALDCCMTFEIQEALEALPQPGYIYDFERALQAPVMEMMLRGIRVSPFVRDSNIKKLRADLLYIENILKRVVGVIWDREWELNKKGEPTFPNSTKQLTDFFYNRLGIPPITQMSKGETKMPMDRKVLEKLELHFQARPIINLILAHRDITGKLEILETQIDEDWRIRFSLNIASTTTGRFSSTKSTTGSGRNMQNITEDLRHMFIADPGHKIAALDKEQAESREVGWFCGITFGDWTYLDAVESGDIHTYCSRLIWPNMPWTGDLKQDKIIAGRSFYRHFSHREITKRGGHGTNYYGKAWTISQELKVPQNLIRDFQEKYFDAFPCISRMHQWVASEIQTKQFLVNVFGRRRDFFDRPNSDETLKAAIAYLFQSATADDMNLGIWRIWKHMGSRVQLMLQLHDAVYFQYSQDDNEEDVIKTAQKHLDVELIHENRKFVVPTEAQTGFNLGHRFKPDKNGKLQDVNPKGLEKVTWH